MANLDAVKMGEDVRRAVAQNAMERGVPLQVIDTGGTGRALVLEPVAPGGGFRHAYLAWVYAEWPGHGRVLAGLRVTPSSDVEMEVRKAVVAIFNSPGSPAELPIRYEAECLPLPEEGAVRFVDGVRPLAQTGD